MAKTTYYMRQIANPISFLNENAALTLLGRRKMNKDIRRHQRDNSDQPYVADLKSGLVIAETPVEIECLSCWLSGRDW